VTGRTEAVESGALVARVRSWIAEDPDPETRAEAEALLAEFAEGSRESEARLRDAFDGRLSFGTGGLRAALGAGPRRMNRVVLSQTVAAIAAYLTESKEEHLTTLSVVVGYDGRRKSEVFARDAAEVLAGAGLTVTLIEEPAPTPLLAFAVRHLGVSAGVMITASHNPPADNGLKVYLGADGGKQLVAPHDRAIAEHITRVATRPCAEIPRSSHVTAAGRELADAYVAETASAVRAGFDPQHAAASVTDGSAPRVVYTAMHGVGSQLTHRVLAAAGLPSILTVAEQDAPDGRFPTLAYPNPEEEGSLALAYATASRVGADVVLAHDPDADRLAVAVRDPHRSEVYRRLNGNELGLLLGWRAAERECRTAAREGRQPRGTLANTLVSSPALGAVARAHGLTHVETLPGFKWVSRVPDLLFGYEEALGYLTDPTVVGDKDGIAAAAEALALICELHASGQSVWQRLDEASHRFGHFATAQIVLRRTRMPEVTAIMQRLREHHPTQFGETAVCGVRDFARHDLAPVRADILAYDLADGSRVMIRPSGTEPKLKVYLGAFSDEGSVEDRHRYTGATLGRLEAAARRTLDELLEAEG